jgi:hypothetical protein
MTRKSVTNLALVAGCVIALAIPAAQAQTMDTQVLTTAPRVNAGDRADWLAASNNAESAQYDRLLQISPSFRQARMHKECGPITDPQLHQNCLASFGQYEPSIGSRGPTMARGTTSTGDFYTGSSTSPGMSGYNQSTHYGAGAGTDWGGLGTTPTTPGPGPGPSGSGAGR